MKKLGSIKNGEKNIFPLITTRPRTMTFAEYQLLTPEQRQGEIIISDYPVPVEGDYVEVAADGNKTYTTLLNELYAKIDFTKISNNTYIRIDGTTVYDILNTYTMAFDKSYLNFYSNSLSSSGTNEYTYRINIKSSNSEYEMKQNGSTITHLGSITAPAGVKITLYYNSTKTLELGTLAQNCMMSDGVTSVEDALDEMIKVIDVPYSDFTWTNATKSFASGNAYPPPNGYTTLGFLVYFTNGDAIASARYGSSSYNVRVMGWIPSSSESVDSTYKFVCKILFKKS